MHNVYSNAVLNLVADTALDCDGGILTEQGGLAGSAAIGVQIRWRDSGVGAGSPTVSETSLVVRRGWVRSALSKGTTAQRAWCIQERLLAGRLIQFTRDQAWWQCPTLVACELFPRGLRPDGSELVCYWDDDLISTGMIEKIVSELAEEDHIDENWNSFIRQFTQAQLTKREDRFAAMAGVVGRILDTDVQLGEEYLAGMWRFHLPCSLLWRREDGEESSASGKRKPTWSWTALECAILPWPVDSNVMHGTVARILHAQVFDAGNSGLLQPSAGRIVMESPIFKIRKVLWRKELWIPFCPRCGRHWSLSDDRSDHTRKRIDRLERVRIGWDWEDDKLRMTELVCAPIYVFVGSLRMLVLVSVEDESGSASYKRVGTASLDGYSLKKDSNTQDYSKDSGRRWKALWNKYMLDHFRRQTIEIW